ncbi:MAG TPA: PepSY domain-containing protein [Bacillota bacterium]|nr:PepSY domain-containing protein [Bacillota bacterium]
MKRIVSIITLTAVLIGILLTGPVTAAENSNLDLKKALEIAKTAFDFDTTNHDFSSSYTETKFGRKLWYLNWNAKEGSKSSMSITVDAATGEIINMYQWKNMPQPLNKIPKYTREEALKVAEALAGRLHPDKFKDTELMDEYWDNIYRSYYSSDSYNFNFIRKIKGIDFQDNMIQVQVDKNTLEVRSFNLDWDTVIPIPDSAKAISADAAKKIFEEKLGIELAYQMIYPNNSRDPKLILVYNQKNANQRIDAITGEIMTQPYYGLMERSAMGGDTAAAGVVLTPEEQKVIDDSSKYISLERAVEQLKKYLPVDGKYNMDNSSLYGGNNNENAVWSISWSYIDKEKNTYSYLYGTVDAVTGEVRSFNISNSENEYKAGRVHKYTKEQCREIAEKFLKEIQPVKFNTSEYRDLYYDIYVDPQNVSSYNINYIRKENGISVPFNNMTITVSAYTGEIINFSMNWQELDFPSAEGVISLEDAYKLLYAKHDLMLKYIRVYNYNKFNDSTEIKLAYMLDDYYGMIDARSGQFIDYSGKPVREFKKVSFTDIEGHKYENDIKLLVELGIIDSTEDKFKPDTKITQKEFVKLLMKATQPDYYPIPYAASDSSEYDMYYENAISQNILSRNDKKPEACITRMEASKMTVNALGVGFVADLSGIFSLNLKDAASITAENKGYAAIAAALGIVDTSAGSFIPGLELTKSETAGMLASYLKVDKAPKSSEPTIGTPAIMPALDAPAIMPKAE